MAGASDNERRCNLRRTAHRTVPTALRARIKASRLERRSMGLNPVPFRSAPTNCAPRPRRGTEGQASSKRRISPICRTKNNRPDGEGGNDARKDTVSHPKDVDAYDNRNDDGWQNLHRGRLLIDGISPCPPFRACALVN